MVDSQGHVPREALGKDLTAGIVHVRTPAQSVAPDQCHRPIKRLRVKTTVAAPARGRTSIPEVPRLRALRNEPQNIPVSEGSAASTVSPRSGPARAHPYYPLGEVIKGSSFEYVPSIANRAASATRLDKSIDVTPIPRSSLITEYSQEFATETWRRYPRRGPKPQK